ncbi:hypothetical protein RND81_06G104900 [Saponaria officinalis]|uniref:Uncharacterized protein n=1 Tax=Saponaria officinalis TaxID=3572 RepID=A0AAW1KA16_SAPOF
MSESESSVEEFEYCCHNFSRVYFFAEPGAGNILDASVVDFLKYEGYLLCGAEVFVPNHRAITASWWSAGWFCIYEAAFRAGLRVPCSPWLSEVLSDLRLAPSQLLPSSWGLLCAIDALCVRYLITLTPSDLRTVYYLRVCERGRFNLRVRSGQFPLVTLPDGYNRGDWKSRFMFMRKGSLGPGGMSLGLRMYTRGEYMFFAFFLALGSVLTGLFFFVFFVSAPDWEPLGIEGSTVRVAAFLEIPVEERLCYEPEGAGFPDFARSVPEDSSSRV